MLDDRKLIIDVVCPRYTKKVLFCVEEFRIGVMLSVFLYYCARTYRCSSSFSEKKLFENHALRKTFSQILQRTQSLNIRISLGVLRVND